jgi:hypothetical protein
VNGVGHGTLNAVASGEAQSHERTRRMVEGKTQKQSQQQQQIDHLGLGAIEDAPGRKK